MFRMVEPKVRIEYEFGSGSKPAVVMETASRSTADRLLRQIGLYFENSNTTGFGIRKTRMFDKPDIEVVVFYSTGPSVIEEYYLVRPDSGSEEEARTVCDVLNNILEYRRECGN